jgi:hypothetical protein
MVDELDRIEQWLGAVHELFKDARTASQGIWKIEIFSRSHIRAIDRDAAAGDAKSLLFMKAIADVGGKIMRGLIGIEKPPICLLCDAPFARPNLYPGIFAILHEESTREPQQWPLITMMVCESCSGAADVRQRLIDTIKEVVTGTARIIEVREDSGRA